MLNQPLAERPQPGPAGGQRLKTVRIFFSGAFWTAGLMLAAIVAFFGLIVAVALIRSWWVTLDNYADYRNGVTVDLQRMSWVGDGVLAIEAPLELGYAETGPEDRCHFANGALLLRSRNVQRVLVMVDSPACDETMGNDVFQTIPADRLTTAHRSNTAAFWLERGLSGGTAISADSTEPQDVNAIGVTEGHPWSVDYLVNCSQNSGRYSLRTRLPNVLYGGSQFEAIASVRFYFGNCLDPRHWEKIEALIDLIGSLREFKELGDERRQAEFCRDHPYRAKCQ